MAISQKNGFRPSCVDTGVRLGVRSILRLTAQDGMLSVEAIADAMWMLHMQPRSAWTLELDLRPYKETF